ncbi:MAG: thrombospondin type 3 repeat-containing protein [Chloroflexi bacterium]|nr:thrombospondin type 3 repeat-containing protein [Chloroflexota bacterium]
MFIEDEFLQTAGTEPVQMWDVSSPATPSYVDGISMGSALMPLLAPAHNLLVVGDRLYVGWYKAGLQAFDFNSTGFISRPVYHQVQTEASDNAYDGAWGVDLATIGTTTYVFQSDRRYGLIVDSLSALDADGDGVPDAFDNCPAWPNPAQNLPPWPVPAGDPDCDGWTSDDEGLIGTSPNSHCGAAWPANINNAGASANKVDIFDVNQLAPPVFFSTAPGPPYQPRFDLAPNGTINVFDVNRMGPPVFFHTCTP